MLRSEILQRLRQDQDWQRHQVGQRDGLENTHDVAQRCVTPDLAVNTAQPHRESGSDAEGDSDEEFQPSRRATARKEHDDVWAQGTSQPCRSRHRRQNKPPWLRWPPDGRIPLRCSLTLPLDPRIYPRKGPTHPIWRLRPVRPWVGDPPNHKLPRLLRHLATPVTRIFHGKQSLTAKSPHVLPLG